MHRTGLKCTSLTVWMAALVTPMVCWSQGKLPPIPVAGPAPEFASVVLRLDQPAGTNQTLVSTEGRAQSADFLRLRLLVAAPAPLTNVSLEVRDGAGLLVDTIDLAGGAGVREIWTGMIPGDRFKVDVRGAPQPAGTTLAVWELLRDITSPKALSIIGADDRKYLRDHADPNLRNIGRAVAKIVYQRGGYSYTCTGFLVSSSRMVTNEHCIPDAAVCATAVVLFDYDSAAMVSAAKQRRCASFRKASFVYDYAIFDLNQPADSMIKPLAFAAASAQSNTRLIVIEHPAGEPKQVSEIDCRAITSPLNGRGVNTDFTHSCDTLGGSSGSPMLDVSLKVVGLHHFGIGEDEPVYNRAVRIEPIVQSLPDLQ